MVSSATLASGSGYQEKPIHGPPLGGMGLGAEKSAHGRRASPLNVDGVGYACVSGAPLAVKGRCGNWYGITGPPRIMMQAAELAVGIAAKG